MSSAGAARRAMVSPCSLPTARPRCRCQSPGQQHCPTPCGGHRHSFTPSWLQGWSRLQKTGSLPGRQQQRTRLGSLPGACGLGPGAVRRPRSLAGPGYLGAPLSSQGCLCSPGDSHQVLQLFPGYLRAALLPGLQLGTLPSSAKINVSACK